MTRLILPAVVLAVVGHVAVPAQQAPPTAAVALAGLRTTHPRLHAAADDFAALKSRIAADPRFARWHRHVLAEAEEMLAASPVERVLVGPRLLAQSRLALDRISTLAGLYRIGGDARFLERARREMLAAAAFSDWNPAHFLDVAEMTNALAIGYDWLHAELSPQDRAAITQAIVSKGLEPGMKAVAEGAWWAVDGRNNWTQVCVGGLVAGALAIADEEPSIASRVIDLARGEAMRRRMAKYAPDGGDEEGPGYWGYATQYTTFYLSALETALGTDFGVARSAGYPETGTFRMRFVGPTGRTFNYADARDRSGPAPQMFWMARYFGRPEYAAAERPFADASASIFHLVYGVRLDPDAPVPAVSPSAWYRGVDVVFLRGAWTDANATWVGFKGGDNRASHGHLDLGSFVLDALGERWAVDLGPDDYNLPAYFGRQRWTYYRLRTESHNTLVVHGTNQVETAKAPVVRFQDTPGQASAVVDLSAAYATAGLSRAHRGVALVAGRDVLVQDEIAAAGESAVDVTWQMLTPARVIVESGRATLVQGRKQMRMTVIEPSGARIEVGTADAPPPQAQQPDVRVIRVSSRVSGPTRITIWFSPDGAAQPPAVVPLSQWEGTR